MIAARTIAGRALMLAGWCALAATEVRAQTPCTGPEVVAEARLSSRWQRPFDVLPRALSSLEDIERCAVVRVRPDGVDADVQVRLPDGRTTTRHVERPDELTTVVRSLVTNLPSIPPRLDTSLGQTPESDVRPSARRSREFGAGLGASLRFLSRPSFIGYGLTGDVHGATGRWVYGAWVRWDVREHALAQRNVPADLVMSSFLLGPYAGARFLLGPFALDATLSANVLVENQEAFEGTRDDVGGDFVEFTVGPNLRLLAPRSSAWRGFALLGADVYPRRVGRDLRRAETLPVLPALSVTLALGVAWSSL